MTQYFNYGQTETDHLSARCTKMADVIARIGHISAPSALMYLRR